MNGDQLRTPGVAPEWADEETLFLIARINAWYAYAGGRVCTTGEERDDGGADGPAEDDGGIGTGTGIAVLGRPLGFPFAGSLT